MLTGWQTLVIVVTATVVAAGAGPVLSSPSAEAVHGPSSAVAQNDTTDFPPGTSADGIENATLLVETQRALLRNTSYVERSDWETVTRVSDGTGTVRKLAVDQYRIRTAVGDNGTHMRIVAANESQGYWLTDDAVALNSSSTAYGVPEMWYEYSRTDPYRGRFVLLATAFQSSELVPYLRDLNYDLVNTTSDGDRTLYTYRSTGIADGVRPNAGAVPLEETTERINATVVVSDRGVVRSFTAREVHAVENETATATQHYSVDGLGETTTRAPAWLSTELARVDASLTGNGTVVEVTHLGGTAVADPVVFLHGPDESRSLRANGTLESGDTLSLYVTTDGAYRTFRASVNDPPVVTDSFVPLGDGNLSVVAFRYVFDDYDSGVQIEVTVRESNESE
ncbi:hypothetical protein [Haloarcula marina]|uniref:hypothetical protein n=1 Tax=Haloarcula marina TaxID=2961574 RepID=UPI0020B78642|nr:hypothetical protein [Halomicroarcula marina]